MARLVTLRARQHALLLDVEGPRPPRVVHWGSDPGPLVPEDVAELLGASLLGQGHSAFDDPMPPTITYDAADGFLGLPAVSGHRSGLAFATRFRLVSVDADADSCTVTSLDAASELQLVTTIRMTPEGALRVRHLLTNLGSDAYIVDDVHVALPLPAQAVEVLDFTGNWSRELHPQIRPIEHGIWSREIREGRTGHDRPLTFMARGAGAGFRSGEVWCLSLAWSGNSRHFVERLADGTTRMGAGELLLPGEILLQPGQRYETPELFAVYSAQGLDGVAEVFHDWLRARPHHPRRPRPLTINVWEAVYFDHRFEKLEQLADLCAEIGVERFVLDDGWFGARRDDRAGLGDWVVSADAWPEGLHPLADCLEARGLEFGLWFEPEMVNPDSDLYRKHPDWILRGQDRLPPEWRHQQVLDLANQHAFTHVLGQMDAILTEYPSIRFIKWDHNRPLTDPGHAGRAGVHLQTLAVYRLMDELKRRHPGLEIESCSSGGGRIDLGIMEHCERVHASDNNEALERQRIQRWTTQLLPLELVDAHVSPSPGHASGRAHGLTFRLVTALFGHAGIEWDITQTTPEERRVLASWAAYYKANRELLHTGRMIRLDHPEPASSAHGVIARDGSRALFAYVQEGVARASRPAPLRFSGLEPAARYRLREVRPAGQPRFWQIRLPVWLEAGVTLSGRVLMEIGVQPPILCAEQAMLIELVRVG